jgi:hypothetical protein
MSRRLPETTAEWIERYKKKARNAEKNYQETGTQRYDSQRYEYEAIIDAFCALERKQEVYYDNLKQRTTNCKWAIDRLVKDSYTRAEVIDLLRAAIDW